MNEFDPTRTYRAAIIGAGSGGLTLAIGLAGFGHDVVLIEAAPIGGDCTNIGCIPSKTLLHAAATGIADPLGHVRRKRDELAADEDHEMVHHDRIHVVRGRGRLADCYGAHVVTVDRPDDSTVDVHADHVVVATGSRPTPLSIDGLDDERVLTNETVFELDAVPSKLVIVGGGAISLEMATAFADLGTSVDIVELQNRLIVTEDPVVSETVRAALEERGIGVHTSTSIKRCTGATAHLADGTTIDDVERVLVAIGRRPNVEGLGLDTAGVETGERGVVADDWGRTSVDGIWAVGDVTGDTLTTHGANAIGRRIVRAIALPKLPKLGAVSSLPNAVYSRPQVASVGLSTAEVDEFPAIGRRRYEVRTADLDRGYTDDVEHGITIVDVERFTGRIMRAAIVGPAATELIGMFTIAIDHGIGLRKLFGTVHPYPSYAQAIGELADEFTRDTLPDLPGEWWAMVRARIPARLAR